MLGNVSAIEAVVIVGAGEAGTSAALALRDRGFERRITLLESESSGPVYRPAMSKPEFLNGDDDTLQTEARRAALLKASVDLRVGVSAASILPEKNVVKLTTGETLDYSRLLLANGSRPRTLGINGGHHLTYLRSHASGVRIRSLLAESERVVVIGGGLIGLEMAASATQLGHSVVVLEASDALLSRAIPRPVAEVLAERHLAEGVRVRLSAQVQYVEQTSVGALRIALQTGEVIECDVAVAGVGAVPNTILATASGVAVVDGILVDASFQTSHPDIFAAGDCCNFPHPLADGARLRSESWDLAKSQGAVAAASMLGSCDPFDTVPWFWTDQYDLNAQLAGFPSMCSATVVRRRADGVKLHFGLDQGGRLRSVGAVGPAGSVGKDVRLAQALIARRATPRPELLCDPDTGLKKVIMSCEA